MFLNRWMVKDSLSNYVERLENIQEIKGNEALWTTPLVFGQIEIYYS